jgi:hypothetical protein
MFLEHRVRLITTPLYLQCCRVLLRANMFGSKMAAKTAGNFRPFYFMVLSA